MSVIITIRNGKQYQYNQEYTPRVMVKQNNNVGQKNK